MMPLENGGTNYLKKNITIYLVMSNKRRILVVNINKQITMSERKRIEQIDRKVANLEKSKEKIDFKISSAVDLLHELETSEIQKLFQESC